MFNAILFSVMLSRGVPTLVVDNLVIVLGRPGCTVQALHNDPTRPVLVCVK